jgi:hypothetical protein
VTITEPATGPVLPALPMPLLGVTPSADHTARIVGLLDAAYADAVAAGANGVRACMTAAADRLDRIAEEAAARAVRALQAHDYPAAAAAAADAHLQSATAHAIRRAVTGDL